MPKKIVLIRRGNEVFQQRMGHPAPVRATSTARPLVVKGKPGAGDLIAGWIILLVGCITPSVLGLWAIKLTCCFTTVVLAVAAIVSGKTTGGLVLFFSALVLPGIFWWLVFIGLFAISA
jgi:hypothetical protein